MVVMIVALYQRIEISNQIVLTIIIMVMPDSKSRILWWNNKSISVCLRVYVPVANRVVV